MIAEAMMEALDLYELVSGLPGNSSQLFWTYLHCRIALKRIVVLLQAVRLAPACLLLGLSGSALRLLPGIQLSSRPISLAFFLAFELQRGHCCRCRSIFDWFLLD